jgi:hypothetical protein
LAAEITDVVVDFWCSFSVFMVSPRSLRPVDGAVGRATDRGGEVGAGVGAGAMYVIINVLVCEVYGNVWPYL